MIIWALLLRISRQETYNKVQEASNLKFKRWLRWLKVEKTLKLRTCIWKVKIYSSIWIQMKNRIYVTMPKIKKDPYLPGFNTEII